MVCPIGDEHAFARKSSSIMQHLGYCLWWEIINIDGARHPPFHIYHLLRGESRVFTTKKVCCYYWSCYDVSGGSPSFFSLFLFSLFCYCGKQSSLFWMMRTWRDSGSVWHPGINQTRVTRPLQKSDYGVGDLSGPTQRSIKGYAKAPSSHRHHWAASMVSSVPHPVSPQYMTIDYGVFLSLGEMHGDDPC